MPNQRARHIKRATITVDDELYAWAMQEARKMGVHDFSTFMRVLISAEMNRKSNSGEPPQPLQPQAQPQPPQ